MQHQPARSQPAIFDRAAAGYDQQFSTTKLARLLRPRVWRRLAQSFTPGQTVLELACGTGEDALWLAGHGVNVVATDASLAMLRVVNRKTGEANLQDRIETHQLSLQEISQNSGRWPVIRQPGEGERQFAGVFSNFGGLNTIGQWQPLAEQLADSILPSGRMVLVVMGPWCPWEIGWFLAHGQVRKAFRRLKSPAFAEIEGQPIPVWYPSAGRLRRSFAPWFRCLQIESLGLWLPPSYLNHLLVRWPGLFRQFERIERRSAGWTGGWGDHYILVLERKS